MNTKTIQLEIPSETLADFLFFCDRSGCEPNGVVAALMKWFVGLDRTTQTLLIGDLHERDRAQVACMVLERMARQMDA